MLQTDSPRRNMFRAIWDLGFHRLVPIVPPDATVSPKSTIAKRMAAGDDSRGKVPGIRNADGQWQGLSLVKMESRETDLDAWYDMGAGVGIKTGEGLVALDIDTTNDQASRVLCELAQEVLGPSAVRIGRWPKCLMLYLAPETTPYKQMRFATPTEPWLDDKRARGGARVELLTEGRQFVADGVHPGTGRAYTWPNGIPQRAKLTEVTEEQIDTFLDRAAERLQGDVARRQERAETPEQEALRAPDWDSLARTVAAVPNTSALFPSRDDYVRMAYAMKAAAPEGYEHEALDLYIEWCGRWEEGENDPVQAMEDWKRCQPPFRTGYSFLLQHAPGLFFDVEGPGAVPEELDMFAANAQAARGGLYDLVTLDDLDTMEPPQFLIDRFLPETGFGILYGAPGSKKSFVALDMAMHLAYRMPDWHGDEIRQGDDRGGVLYVAGEGKAGFKARTAAWRSTHLVPEGVTPDIRFLFSPVNFMRPEDILRLRDTVKHHHPGPLSLIVVDTVSRAIPGADENLQKDMTIFVAACEALQQATGAFVLGIHHAAKTGDMRGSTVFLGQADVVLRTENKKGSDFVRLHCEKQKEAPDGWSTPFVMDEVAAGDATSLVPRRVDDNEPEQNRHSTETQGRILAEMQRAFEDGVPWSDAPQSPRHAPKLMGPFGVDRADADALIGLWLQTGAIEAATGPCDPQGKRRRGYRVLDKMSDANEADRLPSAFD